MIYTIYKISNTVNDKVYIGYTKKDPNVRFLEHIKYSKKKPKYKLHLAIKKYGEHNFKISIIIQGNDKHYIINLEDYYIKLHNSILQGYNMCPGGQGGDIKTDEEKKRLSKYFKENNPSTNEECKKKISKSLKELHASGHFKKSKDYINALEKNITRFIDNNPGKNKSKETIKKISNSQKDRYLTRPESFVSGERHLFYGKGNGIYNKQTEEWKLKEKERRSLQRNSEQYQCEYCNRLIKTNGNWFKHLKIKHNYTDEMILKIKTTNFCKIF